MLTAAFQIENYSLYQSLLKEVEVIVFNNPWKGEANKSSSFAINEITKR